MKVDEKASHEVGTVDEKAFHEVGTLDHEDIKEVAGWQKFHESEEEVCE